MKNTLAFCLLLALSLPCNAQFPKTFKGVTDAVTGGGTNGLTNDEVIAGLKEALGKGAEQSVAKGSALDGFWKDERIRIPFPQEAAKMKGTLTSIGMTKQVEEFELTMNRAAEEAAKEALPVLRDAVTGMSVSDGFAILKGGDHAATTYLSQKTSTTLTERFSPIVARATEKVALTSYWTPLAKGYNKAGMFTGAKAVDPDLDAYVTQKAIDGLFVLIAEEEARIRKDPMARTSDLLQRVFGAK
ncbi:MAG: DUF4197 domain-containing protein [Flavobacteriales bacterium]